MSYSDSTKLPYWRDISIWNLGFERVLPMFFFWEPNGNNDNNRFSNTKSIYSFVNACLQHTESFFFPTLFSSFLFTFKTTTKIRIFFYKLKSSRRYKYMFSYCLFGNKLSTVNVRARYNIFFEQKKRPGLNYFIPLSTL